MNHEFTSEYRRSELKFINVVKIDKKSELETHLELSQYIIQRKYFFKTNVKYVDNLNLWISSMFGRNSLKCFSSWKCFSKNVFIEPSYMAIRIVAHVA